MDDIRFESGFISLRKFVKLNSCLIDKSNNIFKNTTLYVYYNVL